MAAEFTCCECARHVTAIVEDKPPEFRLCAHCLYVPGWFRCARMRAFLCADHSGREAWEAEADDGGV